MTHADVDAGFFSPVTSIRNVCGPAARPPAENTVAWTTSFGA